MNRRRQRGLTLVELMVALVLAMLVMTGVIQLFIGNKKTYRAQDGLARIQESGRFAVFLMSKDLRSGGNLGCSGPGEMKIRSVAANVPAELQPASDGSYQTVAGQDNVSGTIALPSGASITPVAGSDIINIRGLSPSAGIRYVSGKMTASNVDIPLGHGNLTIGETDVLYVSDCAQGDIFRASNGVPAGDAGPLQHGTSGTDADGNTFAINTTTSLSYAYGEDAIIGRLRSNWYYVGQTGRTYEGQPVSALYRVDMVGNVDELLEGVEDMQILYGINDDNDPGRLADRYVTATGVTDWDRVVSTRVNLLVNSVARAADDPVPYDYTPAGTDLTPASDSDRRIRREFSFVSTIRNKTQ
jgi:type IV pilus assembly protein PilW